MPFAEAHFPGPRKMLDSASQSGETVNIALPPGTVVRFGVFELDVRAGELRKSGVKIRLQQQPLQLLQILLQHRGEVVSRDELRRQLWGEGVFVDFDRSLNRAVVKLREALGDLAESPRFIETLPRVGYRFIAPVVGAMDATALSQAPPIGRRRTEFSGRFALAALIGLGLLIFAGELWMSRKSGSQSPPRVLNVVELSKSRQSKYPTVVSDGSRLYFAANFGGEVQAAQISISGGDVVPIATSLNNVVIFDISPDRSNLLVGKYVPYEGPPSLWILPVLGAAPHKVGDVQTYGATWMPGGHRILYASEDSFFVIDPDGGEARKLFTVPGRTASPAWAPDHTRLRFDVRGGGNSVSLWESAADGSNLHPLLPGWNQPANECCGRWTQDGRYYIFQSTRSGRTDLWALRDDPRGRSATAPLRLTNGPLNMLAPFPSADGKKIYAMGQQQVGELVRYDSQSRQFVPYLNGISAEGVAFSLDGEWVTYVTYPEGTLWRSRVDGSERLQLTEPPMITSVPIWSPDGKQIAFVGSAGEHPVWQIYVISAAGGTPQQLTFGASDLFSPSWFQDSSRRLVYSQHTWDNTWISVFDLPHRITSTFPDSQGLCCPAWSRDGKHLFALATSPARIMMYDTAEKKWSELWRGIFSYYDGSRDGSYLYFDSAWEPDPAVYRIRIRDRKLEQVVSLKDFPRTRGPNGNWFDIAPDDSPLLLRNLSTEQLYELDVDLP